MLDNKDEYFIKAENVSQKFSGEFSKNNLTAKLKILLNIFINTSKRVVFSQELATSSKFFYISSLQTLHKIDGRLLKGLLAHKKLFHNSLT